MMAWTLSHGSSFFLLPLSPFFNGIGRRERHNSEKVDFDGLSASGPVARLSPRFLVTEI